LPKLGEDGGKALFPIVVTDEVGAARGKQMGEKK
jgi:hypothetical protein